MSGPDPEPRPQDFDNVESYEHAVDQWEVRQGLRGEADRDPYYPDNIWHWRSPWDGQEGWADGRSRDV